MQATEMRAFQACYNRQRFIGSISNKYPQFLKIYTGFHLTNHRYSQDSSGVSTTYDPIKGCIVTARGSNSNDSERVSDENPNRRAQEDGLRDGDRSYGSVLKASQPTGGSRFGVGKKKSKGKSVWVCSECGYTDGQWWGYCHECRRSSTMEPVEVDDDGDGGKTSGIRASEKIMRSWLPERLVQAVPKRLSDVNSDVDHLAWRFPMSGLFGTEVARVLGGGLVPGSLVLIGGDPGVGKSTLMLQIAALISEGDENDKRAPVLYVSGEESVEQIGNRADRLEITSEELYLYSSTDVEDILKNAQLLSPSPRALVVDSIQTVHLSGVTGSAGGIQQVKECTTAFLRFAKVSKIPVFLIGHVTKSGDIAGPRVLEHIVDAVLYMEGEQHSTHRLLRPFKNRFGSTDELGVFEMSKNGLQATINPSEIFLSEEHSVSEYLAGLAIAVLMDGSRTFVIEIQALCASDSGVSSQTFGMKKGRADMVIAVLTKQVGLKLQSNEIFVNVVSGYTLTETAGDLAVAAAICSSFMETAIPRGTAFIGEIGLGGELRMVPGIDKRVITLAKLGYNRCIVPHSALKSLSGINIAEMEVVGCMNLKEMIRVVFTENRS